MQRQRKPAGEDRGSIQELPQFHLSRTGLAVDSAIERSMADGRRHVLELLLQNAPLYRGIQVKLGKVISSAATTPGGLFRFHLVQGMSHAFGATAKQSNSLACAVEFFHIASLLLDDLPQMDNSMERRGRICPHLLYGEDMVILGALGLITKAYALLGGVISTVPIDRHEAGHALIERCLGTAGIVNGQARDLSFSKGDGGRREVLSIAVQKTVPLIQLALSVPASLFGAEPRTLAILRRLSVYWGLIYQATDDLGDLLEESSVSGKTSGRDAELRRPNIALIAGSHGAEVYVGRLSRLADGCIDDLLENHPKLSFLISFQRMVTSRWESLLA